MRQKADSLDVRPSEASSRGEMPREFVISAMVAAAPSGPCVNVAIWELHPTIRTMENIARKIHPEALAKPCRSETVAANGKQRA